MPIVTPSAIHVTVDFLYHHGQTFGTHETLNKLTHNIQHFFGVPCFDSTSKSSKQKILLLTQYRHVISTATFYKIAASPAVIASPAIDKTDQKRDGDGIREGRVNFEEARMNLATRIMSNGVEVIVADRSSGETLRVAPSSLRPIILAPSTLTEQMLSLLPENEPQASLIQSLRSDTAHFATSTLKTTYTYLSTQSKGGRPLTLTKEHVITNTLVGEPNRGDFIAPTKTLSHVTITTGYEQPVYDTQTLHTTYKYLNTILDGEIPIVVTSKETVTNTLTGVFDLQPSEPALDTNTYFNTYTFTKTLNDEKGGIFTSKHRNIVTQVVITEAPTLLNSKSSLSVRATATTDIVKTYFVTYTYFSTFLEKGSTVIKTNIATSSDVVTEKFYLSPKRTPIPDFTKVTAEIDIAPTSFEPLKVYATKTYLTTFTYFTTLLQGKNTVTSSSTKLVYNVVTEAITSGLDSLYLDSLRSSFAAQTSREPIVTTVMMAGEALEITAVQPSPTKEHAMLSVASTSLTPSFERVVTGSTIIFLDDEINLPTSITSSKSMISSDVHVAPSELVYEEIKPVKNTDTPEYLLSGLDLGASSIVSTESLTSTISATTVINNKNGPATTLVPGDKVVVLTRPDGNITVVPISDPIKKRPSKPKPSDSNEDDDDDDLEIEIDDDGEVKVPSDLTAGATAPVTADIGVSDLLNLGQIGINGLNALGPVINAMAGLIQSNLKPNTKHKDEKVEHHTTLSPAKFVEPKIPSNRKPIAAQREPVYIPVGSIGSHPQNSAHIDHLNSEKHIPGFAESVRPDLPDDNDNAASSWIDTLPIQSGVNERIPLMDRPPHSQIILGKPTMEAPLLQDGIPIQPGQVITANSDVIVGKPSVLGPRPHPGIGPSPISPSDRKPPIGRPASELVIQAIPNDIHPPIIHHSPPPKFIGPKLPSPPLSVPKPSSGSNVAIGMRPPPPPMHPQINFNGNKGSPAIPPAFVTNRFPQTPVNQRPPLGHAPHEHQFNLPPDQLPNVDQQFLVNPDVHHRPDSQIFKYPDIQVQQGHPVGHHHVAPPNVHGIHPSIVQHHIERNTHPVQPSHPLIIQGASTIYYGPNGQPISAQNNIEPIPLPETEPGFIGVSNIGVSDQHIQHPGLDNNEHIITGTIGEPPERPQHLGEVILENPDTMPVLQPGTKLKVPVLSESEAEQHQHYPVSSNIEFGNQPTHSQRPHIDNRPVINRPHFDHGQHIHRPHVEPNRPSFEGPHLHLHPNPRPHLDTRRPNFGNAGPQFENSVPHFEHNRPPGRPQVIDHDISNIPITHHENINVAANIAVQKPDSESQNNAFIRPSFETRRPIPDQTPVNMRPPPPPLRIPSSPQHVPRPDDINLHFVPPPPGHIPQRPDHHSPIIIPLSPNQQQPRPDVHVPIHHPRPEEIITSGGESLWTNSDDDEPVTQEGETQGETVGESNNLPLTPNDVPIEITNERPTEYVEPTIVTKPPFIIRDTLRPPHRDNKRPFIRKPRPPSSVSININNFDENIDIVTARPSVSSHNPLFVVRPEGAADTEKPIFILNNYNEELESQGNTPRPAIRPRPPSSEHTLLLPVPDQGMLPPPPPANDNQNKLTILTPPGKDQQRFPVLETNLQDSTHRPTSGKRPRPSLQQPYPYEIPDEVSIRPTPFKTTRNRTDLSSGEPEDLLPPAPRPTLRPRPTRPPIVSRPPLVRPTRPPPSRILKPHPRPTLEPPRAPPSLEGSILTEPSIQTVISLEGENTIVRTNTFVLDEHTDNIRPTKTVTVFETARPDSTQRYTPVRRPTKTRVVSTRIRPAHSNVHPEPSTDVWPNLDIEATPSFTTESTRPFVTHGAGFVRRPHPSRSRYSIIERVPVSESAPPAVTSIVTLPPELTTRFVTHTETLTVTSTETTVLRSRGQPVTRTVVLTQTEAPRTVVSTIVGTITEIHTLDPSTITTTITGQATLQHVEVTTTVYPPYPQEVFPTLVVRPPDSLPPPQHGADAGHELNLTPGGGHGELDLGVEFSNEVPGRAVINGGGERPLIVDAPVPPAASECRPECDVTKNELCMESHGGYHCHCRPGFARIFQDRPCTPTYTYRMRLLLDTARGERLRYHPALGDSTSSEFRQLEKDSYEGIKRAAMQSELRDTFHGVTVTGFSPSSPLVAPDDTTDLERAEDGVMLNFFVQLSENTEESQLEDKFRKYLQATNSSLGGTEVFAARNAYIEATDFDECSSPEFHDCSEHAQCFNLRGTYTCSCQDGYSDLSPSSKFPGRACSAEVLGCDQCNFHGACYTLGRGDDKTYCDCFHWYAGETCNINLKALLIALVTLGAVMLVLLLVCLVLTCLKKRQHGRNGGPAPGFMQRYRGPAGAQVRGTLDKAAMLQDTSSESSGGHSPLPYLTPVQTAPGGGSSKGGRRGEGKMAASSSGEGTYGMEQDRSLTVMIPRAKYRPVQPSTSVLAMSTFAAPPTSAGTSSGPTSPEQKLLSYLEGGSPQEKQQTNSGKRKQSSTSAQHSPSEQAPRKASSSRKPSTGALVSAGFEVSAQVTRSALRQGANLQGGQCEHLTLASQRSGFTTLRTGDSSADIILHQGVQEAAIVSCAVEVASPPPPPPLPLLPSATVSEARSYDETLVQPPTRALRAPRNLQASSTYGSKPGSSRNDEGQTMAERDVGSTFLMPTPQLYKPARGQGSEASNFDSL